MQNFTLLSSDLAPGDLGSSSFVWDPFEIHQISSLAHPLFEMAYQKLWEEFGARGEMETRETIARRLGWNPLTTDSGHRLNYDMTVILAQGTFVAIRDHTTIVHSGKCVVHLSHCLIDPAHRGTGLAGWLRAWPVQRARESLIAAGLSAHSPITLVAEMEPVRKQPPMPSQVRRLRSYEKAGFLMVDPKKVSYLQPDFRAPDLIDASGALEPVPLRLVLRQVGRENERVIDGSEVKSIASFLYSMYSSCFRIQDMQPLWKHIQSSYPWDEELIELIEPQNALAIETAAS
jgi:GNAT superfamily N-acetyltransferase